MSAIIETPEAVILQCGNSRVEIIPACGAILNRWQLNRGGKLFSLIEGYDDVADFAINCEKKGFRSCKLSPYVCRMNNAAYEFDGNEYSIGKFIANGAALHGLLYNVPFTVIRKDEQEAHVSLVLQYAYKGEDAGYPFYYNMEVGYTLDDNNQLGITTTVTNLHGKPVPLADGWHPYFSLGVPVNELLFEMATDTMLEFNGALIPTGSTIEYTTFSTPQKLGDTSFDNCFILRKPLTGAACKLTNEKDNISVEIYPDVNYPYLQVYIPPHRNSIAIENLSAAPDAFNNHIGLITIEPGEQVSFSTRYKVI